MKKIIFTLLIFSSTILLAQTGLIKGRIISDKVQPVVGANIIVVGTNYGDASNDNGYYEIKGIPYGSYSVEVSSIGFEKRTFSNVNINSPTRTLNVLLKESAYITEQVVVSASKFEQKIEDLTVSTTIIQPEYINRKNFITFDELLRYVPGIQMNLEQVSIRGSSGYSKGVGPRVLVAINGIPLHAGDNGDIVWELIPLSDIERVEIIKGPASSLYGSSAIGGVINIITKSAVKSSVTYVKSYFGAYGNPSYEVWKWNNNLRTFYGTEITHSSSLDNLSYTFSLKKFDNMSYRQNDYSKKYLGYIKLNYSFNEKDYLTFFSNYLYSNRGNFLYWKDSRNVLSPKDDEIHNYVKSNRIFNGLIYHNNFSDKFTTDFKATYYRTKFDGYGIELTTSTANLVRGEVLTNYFASADFTLTTGAEVSYAKVTSNIFKNPNFFGAGAYTQAEFRGISDLIAVVGLRYDYMKLDTISGKNAITPRIGLNYKLDNDLILRASVGTGFRAPTPAEVFTSVGVGGGIDVKENPNLTSEKSLAFEVGTQYRYSNDLLLDLAFYQTDYDNFIEPLLTKEGKIQFTNLSKARIQGLEAILDFSIIPNELNFIVGYNYMWARDIGKNKAMKYRPKNTVYTSLRYSPTPFDFGIDLRYSSKVEEIDIELTQPPIVLVKDGDKRVPLFVTDVTAGYNFFIGGVPVKIYLNAKNIFNYNYVEFIGNLAPIRNFSLSTEIYF